MDMGTMALCLLLFSLLRECMFLYERHKLLNKLMSRNYHEYTLAKNAGKLDKSGRDEEQEIVQNVDIPELMGIR